MAICLAVSTAIARASRPTRPLQRAVLDGEPSQRPNKRKQLVGALLGPSEMSKPAGEMQNEARPRNKQTSLCTPPVLYSSFWLCTGVTAHRPKEVAATGATMPPLRPAVEDTRVRRQLPKRLTDGPPVVHVHAAAPT